jgi:hypothetical protein
MLSGCPKIVHGYFKCNDYGNLQTLVGGPEEVMGDYDIRRCDLRSLLGVPTSIGNDFLIDRNFSLCSLVGGPKEVGGLYSAERCGLTSIEGIPNKIQGSMHLEHNHITSLKGINKLKEMDGGIFVHGCPIVGHILGVFFIKGCLGVHSYSSDSDLWKAAEIVNAHISKGRAGLLACTQELIEAGLSDFAQI